MAEDVARLPSTGITPVVCGDSHLGNFGFYASPERDLVIDLNDFDEAHPGGWEWDLRRLVASIWVAGRHNGTSEEHCGASVRSCVAAYRHELRRLADLPLFTRSFERLDVDRLAAADRGPTAGTGRALGRAGPPPHRGPGPAPLHPRGGRPAQDRRGAAADHAARAARGRVCWPRRSTTTWRRCPRTGGACSAATRWSTSRTRWSASAASACAPTWPCWRVPRPRTWCSCSSSRLDGRCWRATCTATRPGTRTRASGSSSTSSRCRR